ncbi:MAG: hypothetical protein ACLP74_08450 [Thermoplasmata archaeon]
MSESTETLDAVTRLVQAVKAGETTQLAETLKPAIDYFIADNERGRVQREAQEARQHSPSRELDVYQLERYLSLCERLKLDPKDPGTRTILKNLGSVSEEKP